MKSCAIKTGMGLENFFTCTFYMPGCIYCNNIGNSNGWMYMYIFIIVIISMRTAGKFVMHALDWLAWIPRIINSRVTHWDF